MIFGFVVLAMALFGFAVWQWMRAERLAFRAEHRDHRRRQMRAVRSLADRTDAWQAKAEKELANLTAMVRREEGLPAPTYNPFTRSEQRHIEQDKIRTVVGVNAETQVPGQKAA